MIEQLLYVRHETRGANVHGTLKGTFHSDKDRASVIQALEEAGFRVALDRVASNAAATAPEPANG